MGFLGTVIGVVAVAFVALMVGLQVMIRLRTRAMKGTPVPALPGEVGRRVTNSSQALVYFFSPACGACRAITPRVRELEKTNSRVFAIDVTREMGLARALKVMATPSTIEISNGTITGYHVGPIPEAVMARFR